MVSKWSAAGADVRWIRGDCRLIHGDKSYACDEILLIVDGPPGTVRSRIVMTGVRNGSEKMDRPLRGTVVATLEPVIDSPRLMPTPKVLPPIFEHLPAESTQPGGVVALATATDNGAQGGEVRQAQFGLEPPTLIPPPGTDFPGGSGSGSGVTSLPDLPPVTTTENDFQFLTGDGTRAINIVSRNPAAPLQIENLPRPALGQDVYIARGGVTVLIRDVSAQIGGQFMDLGTISLSADRIVAWLPSMSDIVLGNADLNSTDGELYLEGDIVFRQGDRVIYAQSMYYNVKQEVGMILDAEAVTTLPNYQGVVRIKADVLQQINAGNYQAFGAAVTTSRLGVPRYWLQSDQLSLRQRSRVATDLNTGRPVRQTDSFISSRDNFVYMGGLPIFYWPRLSTNLQRPPLYLVGASAKNDDIFGAQVMLEWDVFQLLGFDNAPEGVESTISTDYLSERGPAFGSHTAYELPGLFGIPGRVKGLYDSYLIYDTGTDTLGRDRQDMPIEETWRGRSRLQHRQRFGTGWELVAEFGYLSDRNFLEQYFENEWDQNKDHTTGLRLQRFGGSQMLDLAFQARINDFFKETQQLPVLEHYAFGLSPLGNLVTWSMNNKVGYVDLNVADVALNPAEAATLATLPGEVEAEGLIASTRQELSLPLDIGPLNISPFVGGDATYFGEDVNGDSLSRLTGQAGVRASLPMYRIDPSIQSGLLNIRGLSHKLEWVGEYFYADSDADIDDLPYYDSLDDNAQEQFRRRFIIDHFGGILPTRFDPRDFGFRQGLQRNVTNPSDVIVADAQQIRLGLHQRFQTRRGLPGRERIADIFGLNVDTIVFPDADRDNFGETVGPTTYDASFHLGDRVSLLSDGYIDFFDDGLRSVSAGVRSSRPGLGDVYAGLLSIEGPVSSTVFRTTVDYRLNEKWIGRLGSTYDFSDAGNVGQTFGLTRIGESFLTGFEINVDPGRENVGISFYVLPRFFPGNRSRIGGQYVQAAGVEGLE